MINISLSAIKLVNAKFNGPNGYYLMNGYAIKRNDTGEYMAFADAPYTPYMPAGGKRICEALTLADAIDTVSDNIKWIKEA